MRLAVFGSCCTALGGACLLLAACATTSPRPEVSGVTELLPLQASVALPEPSPASILITSPGIDSPWPRLRETFVLPACDYNPAVRRWTHTYAQNPREFSATLADAMPYLLLVIDQLGMRHLPGEFAFLPYLESNYVPIATSGDRAAGIWQLMPDTAEEGGVRISPDYDGRLDIYAATIGAIGLLQQYHEEFGDWRLADMAFNAGLYKVRQQLANHAHGDWSAIELARLGVNPGTHDHLAKLLALSCIVAEPARFHVRLPEPRRDDALAVLNLPAPVDLRLAARLAGIELARLRQLNPGFLRDRMPADGPFRLLIPASRRTAFERTLGKLPQYTWRNWHEVVLKRPETLDLFAMLIDVDPSALAAVNNHPADASLPPGTHLLLPGVAADTDTAMADNAPAASDPDEPTPESFVVHAGDTLWQIAHRYGVHVADLQRWNGLDDSAPLRLGQKLMLNAPERLAR